MGSSPDQYTCDCTGTGYQGVNCEEGMSVMESHILFVMYNILLIDVNECETGDHNCAYYATCVNTEGTFICEFQEEVIKDRLRRRKRIIQHV